MALDSINVNWFLPLVEVWAQFQWRGIVVAAFLERRLSSPTSYTIAKASMQTLLAMQIIDTSWFQYTLVIHLLSLFDTAITDDMPVERQTPPAICAQVRFDTQLCFHPTWLRLIFKYGVSKPMPSKVVSVQA
jgi:hypothetical protein